MSETKTKVLIDGTAHFIFKHDGIKDELPNGVYEIRFNQMGPYLDKVSETIDMPAKVYNNDTEFIQHVIKTYNNAEAGVLGIGLVGGKGLGKSFTANLLAKEVGLPVIKLTQAVTDTSFMSYLKQLKQDYVLFIDEFEKTLPSSFDSEDKRLNQEELLSFLDGGALSSNKVMFIITSNSAYKITEFIKNRPSRLRYFKEYDQLDEVVIKEVLEDLLVNKEHQDDLLSNLPYSTINLDALIKIVQEINIHDKPYSSFKSFFNFKEEMDMNVTLVAKFEGKDIVLSSNFTRAIDEDCNLGFIKNNKGRSVSVYSRQQVIETPLDDIEIETYFYDDEGNENDLIVKVIPNATSLKQKYLF